MNATLSRRHAMSVMAGAAVAAASSPSAHAADNSLGSIAAKNGFVFGAAAGPVIDKDAAYRQLYIDQTKIITSDIALKMSRVAPASGPLRFEAADRLHQFCTQHAIPMRGHCLIWNEWVPAWIKAMSNAEREKFFDSYVVEVIGRYAGQFQSWDIVNEPFWPGHKAPGGYRLGPWYETFGQSYVKRTFQRAGSVDKRTKFVLNEAHAERDDETGQQIRAGLLRLVDELKDAGVWLVGAVAEAEDDLFTATFSGPIAMILGAEGTGLRRLTAENCDELVRIPMFGTVESLNVSVASGICLYEARRQRNLVG